MRLYADIPARRIRQVAGDALAAAGVALAVRAGIGVHRFVERLAEPARAAEEAGLSVARSAGRGQAAAADVPLVGGLLRAPFEALRDGGMSLAEAGQAQQMFVDELAWWLGVLVAVLPILVLLATYMPRRMCWMREASAARRLAATPEGTDVLAARARATLPLARLAQVSRDRDALAAAMLATLGMRPWPPARERSPGRPPGGV